jgi:hypothetical protein
MGICRRTLKRIPCLPAFPASLSRKPCAPPLPLFLSPHLLFFFVENRQQTPHGASNAAAVDGCRICLHSHCCRNMTGASVLRDGAAVLCLSVFGRKLTPDRCAERVVHSAVGGLGGFFGRRWRTCARAAFSTVTMLVGHAGALRHLASRRGSTAYLCYTTTPLPACGFYTLRSRRGGGSGWVIAWDQTPFSDSVAGWLYVPWLLAVSAGASSRTLFFSRLNYGSSLPAFGT